MNATAISILRHDRNGFTLVELLSILMILGVVALVAASRITSMNVDATVEADRLKANLRFAQYLAMSNNTVAYSVTIASGSYTLQEDGVAAAVNFPDSGSPTHSFGGGVSVTSGTGTLTFDEWGSPGTTNYVITISDGSPTNITITRNTGFIL